MLLNFFTIFYVVSASTQSEQRSYSVHRSRTELIGSTALNHSDARVLHGTDWCFGMSPDVFQRKGKEQGKIKCSFLHSLLDSRDKFEPKVVGSIAEILINRMIHIFFVQSESQAD